jgi:alpha-1,4-glucan:alpha-1,4-glucan 6-glycosyltransferase/4-alpha-glucanotransferase
MGQSAEAVPCQNCVKPERLRIDRAQSLPKNRSLMSHAENDLLKLAREAGVQTEYTSNAGHSVRARPDALAKMLQALGHAVADDGANARTVLDDLCATRATRWLEPVYPLWENEAHFVVLSETPESGELGRVEWTLRLEDGSAHAWSADVASLRIMGERADETGRKVVLRQLMMPRSLPLGYHALSARAAKSAFEATLVCAPASLPRPEAQKDKGWGAFVPTYALRSDDDWGAGDFSALGRLSDWLAERGAQTVATLPLLPAFIEDWKCDPSPYSPASRLMWNDFYLDPTRAAEWDACEPARKIAASEAFRAEVTRLKREDYVDYLAVQKLKKSVLEPMSQVFGKGMAKNAAFQDLLKRKPALAEYARFRAACDHFKESWWCWPEKARAGTLTAGDWRPEDEIYHLYVQFLAHQQLGALAENAAAKGMSFYLDLPVGVSSDGYDVWRERDAYALGLAAGAPPDPFFTKGQNWGFPPFHPERLRAGGYRHFAEIIRHHLSEARILRIDHVMGLTRLYCVPHGFGADQGVYIRFRQDELYAVLLLEAQRAGASLVGEDLGTVPQEVVEIMAKRKLDRLFVFQYEANPHATPPVADAQSNTIASLNTHDMPTWGAYWNSRDLADREALGLLAGSELQREATDRARIREGWRYELKRSGFIHRDSGDLEVVQASFKRLAATQARTVLVTLEDLWLEERPQNIPGTHLERPNWKRKLSRGLEEIQGDAEIGAFFGELTQIRRARPVPTRLGEADLHFFNEGSHSRLHEKLGAHLAKEGGRAGTFFAVWAPDADAVSVLGDFNGWNAQATALHPRGNSGVWEAFVPGVGQGALYKYSIRPRGASERLEKADPFAFAAEAPPRTASIVHHSEYEWKDAAWMQARKERNALGAPQSVYELHLGSWRRAPEDGNRMLSCREIAPLLSKHVKMLGFTHVELMPVMQHPFYGSWGYQLTGYFAPSSYYGPPDELKFLIDHLHQEGIGVLLDWVPSHFPEDPHGLARFDGSALYEHADPRKGFHPDWKSAVFNYGRNEVRAFLISNACYWLEQFHADGLRVDAVASMLYLDYSRKAGEWVPNAYGGRENLEAIQFLRQLNERVYAEFPDVQVIAEESTAWGGVSRPTYSGGLGFGMKWDMGWMHDTLQFFRRDAIHRKHHLNELSFRGLYQFTENFMLALSHDEVVHGKGSLLHKMPGDDWQKFANLRLLYAYMWALPGKKLLFMGGEFAQRNEWRHDGSLDWHLLAYDPHKGMQRLVSDLNRILKENGALHDFDFDDRGFEWVDARDAENSVLSFLRKGADGSQVLCVLNLTPVPRPGYRVGVPTAGEWTEIFNSDALAYGGTGVGNLGRTKSEAKPEHGRPSSLSLMLPPLGALLLRSPPA